MTSDAESTAVGAEIARFSFAAIRWTLAERWGAAGRLALAVADPAALLATVRKVDKDRLAKILSSDVPDVTVPVVLSMARREFDLSAAAVATADARRSQMATLALTFFGGVVAAAKWISPDSWLAVVPIVIAGLAAIVAVRARQTFELEAGPETAGLIDGLLPGHDEESAQRSEAYGWMFAAAGQRASTYVLGAQVNAIGWILFFAIASVPLAVAMDRLAFGAGSTSFPETIPARASSTPEAPGAACPAASSPPGPASSPDS